MSAEKTTDIPSPINRLVEILTADKDGTTTALSSDVAKAVLSIGTALGSAGVALSASAASAAQLGALNVDPKLPALVAATGRDRGSRGP